MDGQAIPKTISKTSDAGLIYKTVPAIMAEIPAITKARKNEAQRYNFRGIDDVYNTVSPILAKHGVFMRSEIIDVRREERASKSGGTMAFVQVHVRYYLVAGDGSSISTDSMGEGMDSGDKATAKAMSIAQKYAILQMFCIPTADPKDPENDNPEPMVQEQPPDDPLEGPNVNNGVADKNVYKNIKIRLSDGKFHMLSKFDIYKKYGNIKEKIGPAAYYEIIGAFGYEHANDIPDKKLPDIYATLLERMKS